MKPVATIVTRRAGCTGPVHCGIIIAALLLVNVYPPVTCLSLNCRIMSTESSRTASVYSTRYNFLDIYYYAYCRPNLSRPDGGMVVCLTADSVKWTTAFSATFVAVTAICGAVWNQTQFACCTGYHPAYSHSSCCRGACVPAAAAAPVGCEISQEEQQQKRGGFALVWRPEWAVTRVVPALNGADTALHRPGLYIGR